MQKCADLSRFRREKQQELERFTPIPENDLERAADLLENFADHWTVCEDDTEAQYNLIKLIVKRVYVLDEEVVAMTLRSDYHVVLGHKLDGPTEVPIDLFVYNHGSDGGRALVCIQVLVFVLRHITSQYLPQIGEVA